MRYLTCDYQGQKRVGRLSEDTVELFDTDAGDLVSIIESVASGGQLPVPVEFISKQEIRILAPIQRLRRDILCTGWNYWDHFEEGKGRRDGQDVERPMSPTFFTKGPDTVIAADDPISFDSRISAKWDYEVELGLVIGKAGRSIHRDDAMGHVFGYFLVNDISQRDLQRRHGAQWLKGKSIDGTMPMGPCIVTPDELDVSEILLECILNGETMQSAHVRQMAFPIAELISELSFGMTLRPGDVIITGTPAGIGNARTPPIFLKAGDEVVCRGTGLGELRNTVTEADLYGRSSVSPMDGAP